MARGVTGSGHAVRLPPRIDEDDMTGRDLQVRCGSNDTMSRYEARLGGL